MALFPSTDITTPLALFEKLSIFPFESSIDTTILLSSSPTYLIIPSTITPLGIITLSEPGSGVTGSVVPGLVVPGLELPDASFALSLLGYDIESIFAVSPLVTGLLGKNSPVVATMPFLPRSSIYETACFIIVLASLYFTTAALLS